MISAALAVAALGAAGTAAASDVFWSVGVHAAPGVNVRVGNAPRVGVVVAPQPYYQPAPVYVQPAPVYYPPPPVYYRPRPVYYQPQPVVVYPGYGYGHGRPPPHFRGNQGYHRGHDHRR
jgi:hypothetical protein